MSVKRTSKLKPRVERRELSPLVPVSCYLRRPHHVDDPMWVIGCIDAYGAITARHANSRGRVMHGQDESRGKRWRWNIWGQEFTATRNGRLDEMNDEELAAVTEWLERHGYKKADNADLRQDADSAAPNVK